MKRDAFICMLIAALTMCVILIFEACGRTADASADCASQSTVGKIEPTALEENAFTMIVSVQTADEVYKLAQACSPTDETLSGHEVTDIDGAPLTGEVCFSFVPQDFPSGSDVAPMSQHLIVYDKNGVEYPTEELSLEAAYGRTVSATLTGSAAEGYVLTLAAEEPVQEPSSTDQMEG